MDEMVNMDDDLDSGFLQKFNCLGTTDKEVLITELQSLLDNKLSQTAANFFLEMNNWNLQAAACSYFDYECPKLLSVILVKDVTIGEGEEIPPCTKFVKTWRLKNDGEEQWPPGCCLKFIGGCQMTLQDRVMVDALYPCGVTDVSIEMISPSCEGTYHGKWKMSTPTGTLFGDIIWVIVIVSNGETMALTQQLSQFKDLGSTIDSPQIELNPFAVISNSYLQSDNNEVG